MGVYRAKVKVVRAYKIGITYLSAESFLVHHKAPLRTVVVSQVRA